MSRAEIALGAILEVPRGFNRLAWLYLDGGIAQDRGAMHQIHPPDLGQLGLPTGEQLVGVVRLHPTLEKARRQRKTHDVVMGGIMLERTEPALEILVAHGGAQ